jgi:nicotinamidase-related amidase
MSSTLVVIDMQPTFPAAQVAFRGVHSAVRSFSARGRPVLFVEYAGEGATFPALVKAAQRWEATLKQQDDGSKEIIEVIQGQGWPTTLYLCGVNTQGCVSETVLGLHSARRSWPIKLIASACADEDGVEPSWIKKEYRLRSLRIVQHVRWMRP